MKSHVKPPSARAAVLRLALGLCLGLGLAAGGAFARPKPPVIDAPPMPPPPPPMPAVSLASRFIAEAAAYQDYMTQAVKISPAFTDPANVAASLKLGVAYEPGQFRHGEVAYGAIAALADPRFVAAVRAEGATERGRYNIVARIFNDPSSALQFADGRVAAGLVKQAITSGGLQLFNDGAAVKQAAYDIQHQAWSSTDVAGRDARKDAVKALSAEQRTPSPEETAVLAQLMQGAAAPGAVQTPAPPPYPPLVVRALALATLAAIGQAGDADANRLDWLTDDYFMDHCLAEAKLSLFECLAVAKPNYEDVFCLGQHALTDTGSCVVRGAGGTVPTIFALQRFTIPPVRGGRGARPPAHRRR